MTDIKYLHENSTKITPEVITSLGTHEIFVFGSNEIGVHGAGAAKMAFEQFGAIMKCGVGLMGASYAIPTKDSRIETLPKESIQKYVNVFLDFARRHPQYNFLVTPIGCGLAGYQPKDIAPMFFGAIYNHNIYLPESFRHILGDLADMYL